LGATLQAFPDPKAQAGNWKAELRALYSDMRARCDCQSSYDAVADEYVRRIYDELKHKPLDRALLDRFADAVRDRGGVCDLGCGPGHVARYLKERGIDVVGYDLSPKMVEAARRLHPEINFDQADMTALDHANESWAGIVAFYSLIHIPAAEIPQTLRGFQRCLQPGGLLLLSFHVGDETLHLDDWWERKVNIDFFFFRPEEMARDLAAAGFDIEEIIEREPYPDVEHQSRRAYIFARRPAIAA
jgi:SAM-dependent methyltransferase